jgi:hypothetical protein
MALRVEIRNLDEVQRILEQLGAKARTALPAAVEEGAKVLAAKIAANAPGPHIAYEMNGSSALVGPDKAHFYYAFFETGTGAHRVDPVRKQALHWGGEAFSAGHAVGGVTAAPFMRPAVDEGADEVGEAVGRVLVEALA